MTIWERKWKEKKKRARKKVKSRSLASAEKDMFDDLELKKELRKHTREIDFFVPYILLSSLNLSFCSSLVSTFPSSSDLSDAATFGSNLKICTHIHFPLQS